MIRGSKYPSKKRINLYQREISKKTVVFQCLTVVFILVFLQVCVRFLVVGFIQQAEHREQLYRNMEHQLEKLRTANQIMEEVTAEFAHYGDSCLNEEEKKLPSRLRMLETLNVVIFPICTQIATVSITDDKMELNCILSNGTMLSELIKQVEADEAVRYVTASVETVKSDEAMELVFASEKEVDVQMTVYFKASDESEETS